MIVAAIVLYAGITSLVESVRKIIHPEAADYSVVSLVIIASAVVVKILLGNYVKAQGKKVNSGALIASGEDARFDAILSASVLASVTTLSRTVSISGPALATSTLNVTTTSCPTSILAMLSSSVAR
jgi:divalent metal cation (Fe/Co/Zn/Cd) transporter